MEIKKLQAKNLSLLKELKRVNQDLDIKMEKAKRKGVTSPVPPAFPTEQKLLAQLASANKMLKRYETELNELKIMDSKTGYEQVVELETKYAGLMKVQEELVTKAKDLRKQTKISGKVLTRHTERIENKVVQIEEKGVLKLLNKAREQTASYEERLKKIGERLEPIETTKLEGEVASLEKEMCEIKKEALAKVEKFEVAKCNTNALKEELKKYKELVETESKRNRKEQLELLSQLNTLRTQFKELEHVFSACLTKLAKQNKYAQNIGSQPYSPNNSQQTVSSSPAQIC
eukprot:TRINITY_DN1552_c0_g1_i1.p5 TRINITY_DN1552_c0_g1~~TRINITY_DN1552_c0_g1_i1.p5  ORF type:complete len:288 (+),score=51.56 TRINITY_DN1552_c0_g1_i1:5278-6141(+)